MPDLPTLQDLNLRMYLLSFVKSSLKVVIIPVSTAVNVTSLVPLIVVTACVTYKVERVSLVNLDGLVYIVIKHVLMDGTVLTAVSSV